MKVICGILWLLVVGLLSAFLFKAVPFDGTGIFVFIVLFVMATISIGGAFPMPAKPLVTPAHDTDIRVSIAGEIFTGDQLTVLRLQNGGLFIDVRLGEFEESESPTPTKKPVKIKKP